MAHVTLNPPVGPLLAKAHLVARGIRQQDLAAAVGLSPEHVSHMLNGRRAVTRSFALAAARFLRLGPDETSMLFGSPESWGRGRWPTP